MALAPDCPGFGGSDAPQEMLSMEELAETVLEALEGTPGAPAGPVDLMGFHSGCLLAVEMARLKPDRVRKLAIVDVPYFNAEEQKGRYTKSTAPVRYDGDLASLADAWEFSVARRLDGMPFSRAFGNFVELLRAGERANWGYHATPHLRMRAAISGRATRNAGRRQPVHAQGTHAQGRGRHPPAPASSSAGT